MTEQKNRIAIAILALGGQGGGVLAEWIQHVAREHGWIAQGTSVPGVAQRTGSTVYYVELALPGADGRVPVMAQMPMPGDVDIVVASELMETGRAVLRGFSTKDRTTLIGSTHRIYAISEKQVAGDGRGNGDKIIAAAQERSARFIGFDMEAATERTNSVISAIMFGALAGSGALPFSRESFEQAIHHSGKAVKSNLVGFAEGFARAQGPVAMPVETEAAVPLPTTPAGQALAQRVRALPEAAHALAMHGVARLMDYQDAAYAALYLDRLEQVAMLDGAPHTLTAETARHLALWMAYEDTIRVADLKVRASRFARVADEVKLKDGQVLTLTEFMHPRLQELAEVLPAGIARRLLQDGAFSRWLGGRFAKGRHARTTGLRWFLLLRMVAGLRSWRPRSLRYAQEQARIEAWLDAIATAAVQDKVLAVELAQCQRLLKGYGDTFERGLDNFQWIMERHSQADAAQVRQWREKALADDKAGHLARMQAA